MRKLRQFRNVVVPPPAAAPVPVIPPPPRWRTATLDPEFDHWCTDRDCGGVVVETKNGASKVRKAAVQLDGRSRPRLFDTVELAREWAEYNFVELRLA